MEIQQNQTINQILENSIKLSLQLDNYNKQEIFKNQDKITNLALQYQQEYQFQKKSEQQQYQKELIDILLLYFKGYIQYYFEQQPKKAIETLQQSISLYKVSYTPAYFLLGYIFDQEIEKQKHLKIKTKVYYKLGIQIEKQEILNYLKNIEISNNEELLQQIKNYQCLCYCKLAFTCYFKEEIDPLYEQCQKIEKNIQQKQQLYVKFFEEYEYSYILVRFNLHDESLKILQKLDQNNEEVQFYIGSLYYKKEPPQYDKALQHLQISLKINPIHSKSLFLTGLIYSFKDDYQKAIEYQQKCLQVDKYYQNCYINLGYCHQHINETQKAIQIYIDCLEYFPNCIWAFLNTGNLYASSGDSITAIKNYEKCIEIDPEFTQAQFNIALTYHLMGQLQYQKAKENYLKCLKIDENYVKALSMLGTLEYTKDQHNINAYLPYYKKALKLDKKSEKFVQGGDKLKNYIELLNNLEDQQDLRFKIFQNQIFVIKKSKFFKQVYRKEINLEYASNFLI